LLSITMFSNDIKELLANKRYLTAVFNDFNRLQRILSGYYNYFRMLNIWFVYAIMKTWLI